jgi:hypothetical protein
MRSRKASDRPEPFVLAAGEVCCRRGVEDGGGGRASAEDAGRPRGVDYDGLRSWTAAAIAATRPACVDIPSNLFTRFPVAYGDSDKERVRAPRLSRDAVPAARVAHPMKGAASPMTGARSTPWSSTQLATKSRDNIAEMLGLGMDRSA